MSQPISQPNSYTQLKKALYRETNIMFPQCLKYLFYTSDNYSIGDIENDECICGVPIKYIFHVDFIHRDEKKILDIGSTCIEKLMEDMELIKDKEIYEHWKQQVIKILKDFQMIKNKYKKCLHCKKDWTHKRCFHKGLCKECKQEYNKILNTKIILNKYVGRKLKDIKNERRYLDFCIEKKTRQHQLFTDYLNFMS